MCVWFGPTVSAVSVRSESTCFFETSQQKQAVQRERRNDNAICLHDLALAFHVNVNLRGHDVLMRMRCATSRLRVASLSKRAGKDLGLRSLHRASGRCFKLTYQQIVMN